MIFFMLSDLHLADNHGIDTAELLVQKICKKIREEISPDKEIPFIFMGDLIEKGSANAFDTVRKLLDLVCHELQDYRLALDFLPGNHDLTLKQLEEFDLLIKEYGVQHSYTAKSVYSKVYDKVNFIFADSTLSRDYSAPGQIDIDAICSKVNPDMENLLFCHHAFTQSLGGDHDCVTDGWAYSKQLREAGVTFLFHGHTHRADRTFSHEFMTEIGCGSLSQDFSEMQEGVCHQFSIGYIRDGKIVMIERWIAQVDGAANFVPETLYPENQKFSDPDTIGKKTYPPVCQPYIARKVLAHKDTVNPTLLPFCYYPSLQDAWNADNRLLLLGVAGQGKSIEMQNLAFVVGQTYLFPFFYLLRDYTGSPIAELLPKDYQKLLPARLALIFDGYDELTSDFRGVFQRELNTWTKENPLARVLISSRGNFCKSEFNSSSRTFTGFTVYDLCTLSEDDIFAYLGTLSINKDVFWNAAKKSQIIDLLFNPFYLTGIADIFCEDNRMPNRANLMNRMIQRGFRWDDDKYTDNLEEHQYELFSLMKKVAMAMQLMRTNSLDDGTEYQLLFSWEERKLIGQSGLLTKSANVWRFTHNNFREYLAAQYLSELPFCDALSFFSIHGEVRPSWVNTLGYLTSLWPDETLTDWLVHHAPGAVVKFEPDRIEPSVRLNIMKALFQQYEEKNLIFSNDLFGEEDLAHFAHCPEAIDFLLTKISIDAKQTAQYNALRVLKYFSCPHSRTENVTYRLLQYCAFYPETSSHTCRLAIHAIYQLGLAKDNVTERLMHLFQSSDNDYIRLGLYEYLNALNLQDKYIDFFLDGIKYVQPILHSGPGRVASELYELKQGLLAVSTSESLVSILNWFIVHQKNINFYDADSVFIHTVEKATDLYQHGEKQIFTTLVDACIWAINQGEMRKENAIIDFFEKTNTVYSAVVSIINRPSVDLRDIGILFRMYPVMFDCAEKAYLKDEYHTNYTLFRQVVCQYVINPEQYDRCADYIQEKEGIRLPDLKPPVDYEELRRKSQNEFFSIFFDKTKAERMLLELIERSGRSDITVGELKIENAEIEPYSPLLSLQYAIQRHVSKSIKAADSLSHIDWQRFVIEESAMELESTKDLQPTEEQKKALREIVCRTVSNGAFCGAVKYDADNMTISFLADALVSLAVNLDCNLQSEYLLKMTEFPEVCFPGTSENRKYAYLMSKLPLECLNSRIADNLSSMRVRGSIMQDHIEYCSKVRFDGAVETACLLCTGKLETSYNSICFAAFNYLYDLMGRKYVESNIIPSANGELLCYIAETYKDISQNILKETMERQYQIAPTIPLQSILITFNSKVALEQYVESICKTHAFPEGDSVYGVGLTTSVAAINEPNFLPLLGELLEVSLSPDFRDRDFGGLRDSVIKSFFNCGKENPDATISEVKQHLSNEPNNDDRCQLCNYIIEEVLRIRRGKSDVPWSITEVKKLINSN